MSGYVFPNSDAIFPHLEWPKTGPTSLFCEEISKRLHAWVAGGYPERLKDHEVEDGVDDNGNSVRKVGANSAVVYSPDGECVCNYRKTNLFRTDMTWAKAGKGSGTLMDVISSMCYSGTGFGAVALCSPPRQATLGLCMDLNTQPPAIWDTLDGPYELARHHLASKSSVLILLNAWLDSEEDPENEVDERTLNYWAMRLRPLWSEEEEVAEKGTETMVVVCNRAGEENGRLVGENKIRRLI